MLRYYTGDRKGKAANTHLESGRIPTATREEDTSSSFSSSKGGGKVYQRPLSDQGSHCLDNL